jgi:mono/diheme cytochrome c family protein
MLKKEFSMFFLVIVAGCIQWWPSGMTGGQASTPSLEELRSEFDSNGEMIFYTGLNEKGERIQFEGGPHWIYMHGGACVSCHGEGGKGGAVPHMCFEEAPSIKYHDLTEEEHEEHAEGEEEPHPPYTDETIKSAIREGFNPADEKLDPCMPRWQMSESDMNDVLT